MTSILLLPLGQADRYLTAALREPVRRSFNADVRVVEADVPLAPFHDSARHQYNASLLLCHLAARRDLRPAEDVHGRGRVLAIVSTDLFIPTLAYVVEEAELGGCMAVVSYHRLRNEAYGLAEDRDLLAARLRKESLHTLGHTYGLNHCGDPHCVMHASAGIADIDIKGDQFCLECRETLHMQPRRTVRRSYRGAPPVSHPRV